MNTKFYIKMYTIKILALCALAKISDKVVQKCLKSSKIKLSKNGIFVTNEHMTIKTNILIASMEKTMFESTALKDN